MKGKRKEKTSKWLMKAQFELEAQRLLASRTNAASRFLNAALQAGLNMNPLEDWRADHITNAQILLSFARYKAYLLLQG